MSTTEELSGPERIRIEQHSRTGTLWFYGGLFAIGLLAPGLWQGGLAPVLRPYYLGATFAPLLPA